jgi:hypothetical protein
VLRNPLTVGAALASAAAVAATASAGPFVGPASRTTAYPGDVVRVRAGAGLRFYALLPLYLVPRAKAPQDHDCVFRGHAGVCVPTASRIPHGGIYHRIGTVNVRHRNEEWITYRVPRLAPGRYVYVLYCGPCYSGPGGSLISFDHTDPGLTVL